MRPSKDRLLEVVTYVEPGSDDVTYTHAVFAQCFLPHPKASEGAEALRGAPRPRGARRCWRVRSSTRPRSGSCRWTCPRAPPHGSRSRTSTITSSAQRASTRRSPCRWAKASATSWTTRGSPSAARTARRSRGRSITSPPPASALGVWNGEHARQINTQIADAIDFWLEKDRRQRTLWQPVMRVSEPYAEAVREHCVPHDMRALIGLYENTRAMDIYVWLSYRLPRVPERRDALPPLRRPQARSSARASRELRKFRQLFKPCAPGSARVVSRRTGRHREPEGIRLFHSPSPVPIDLARSPYGRTIAGGRRRLRLVHQAKH